MLYIGIDLGTSAIKLLLMDQAGKIHNIVSREYPLYFPHPGWSEQNPYDWYEQAVAGIKELIADAASQRHSFQSSMKALRWWETLKLMFWRSQDRWVFRLTAQRSVEAVRKVRYGKRSSQMS